MPKIQDLLREWDKVWFLIGNEKELEDRFLKEVLDLGCTFPKGEKPMEGSISPCMSVSRDLKLTYVSSMLWNMSFSPDMKTISISPETNEIIIRRNGDIKQALKADYAAFCRGDKNFVYTKKNDRLVKISLDEALEQLS